MTATNGTPLLQEYPNEHLARQAARNAQFVVPAQRGIDGSSGGSRELHQQRYDQQQNQQQLLERRHEERRHSNTFCNTNNNSTGAFPDNP